MGRDHTLHASVAGYVKYYRDPRRHPDRQYIGVTFTRDDTLPYPPGAPRKRKLGLVAVPRRPVPPEAPLLGPSGIPRYVVRHENELVTVTGDETTETMTTTTTDTTPGLTMRRLGKKRDRQKNVLVARTLAHAARSAARRNTRVFRLQADYSYRETNWEIGRLVGPVGRVGGTNPVGSRRARLRARRRRRIARFKAGRAQALVRARSKRAYDKIEAEQKALKAAEEAAYAAKQKAKREAREKADREKVEAAKAQAQAQAQAQAKGTDDKTDDKKDGEETKDA
ncbi:hypothetical protein P8C59_004894 [Phyllachora maydis]|nr:hypothetical protein P8C59_004894 [Phyllachora maydis]